MSRAYLVVEVAKLFNLISSKARIFFGIDGPSTTAPGRRARVGLAISGLFLASTGLSIILTSGGSLGILTLSLVCVGMAVVLVSVSRKLRLAEANVLTLTANLSALIAFYYFFSRFVTVTYSTDAIVGTYLGVVKVLQLQNPYLFSIKPLLDQFGFAPSSYTPRVDGSFEFHLNYPAFNFLSLAPLYLAGLHDLRDGVLFFHIMSLLLIYGVVPSKLKALSIAPFAIIFPPAIVTSWTDSVWAFLLVLTVVFWYRNRNVSLVSAGLAVATKQIAVVVVPFLLIRMLRETREPMSRGLARGFGMILAGFLLPNVPFLLLSPSDWWVATVGPFLPNSTPQIIGGIGLSEFLLDIGLTPPSSFFLVLVGMVALASLYFYTTRFERAKQFIWVMPILIMFFYHRSLPNYIVYWLFPLIPEVSRFSLAGVHWRPALPVRFTWPSNVGLPLDRIRRKMPPSILIGMVLTMALVGVSGAYISQASGPKVEVQMGKMADPDSLGAVTLLNVTVTNLSDEPISPRFFIKWTFLPYLWTGNSRQLLPPKSSGQYMLAATDPLAAIPRGTPFRVYVYDSASGQLAGQSQMLQAEIPPPKIANPLFRWWTLDPSTGRKVPFGWKLLMPNIDSQHSGIEALDNNVTSGVHMALNYTSTMYAAAQISLSQKMLFNVSMFDALMFQSLTTDMTNKVMLGARVTDGTHLVYFIFSDTASQRSVATYPQNTTVTIPLGPSAWTTLRIDPISVWKSQGWSDPGTVEFSLYIEASFYGYYYANIKEISLASS